jgi:hypothetical protein
MKSSTRILIATLVASIALPLAVNAAKADRKGKNAAVSFEAADKNNDKSVDKDEYVAAMKAQLGDDGAKSKFATADKNSDGKLTKEEYDSSTEAKKKRKKDKN